jgi:hypothetical protein
MLRRGSRISSVGKFIRTRPCLSRFGQAARLSSTRSATQSGVVDFRSAVLWERWHHLGGEALHALPRFSAADEHIPNADRLQVLAAPDDLLGRTESAAASVAPTPDQVTPAKDPCQTLAFT